MHHVFDKTHRSFKEQLGSVYGNNELDRLWLYIIPTFTKKTD